MPSVFGRQLCRDPKRSSKNKKGKLAWDGEFRTNEYVALGIAALIAFAGVSIWRRLAKVSELEKRANVVKAIAPAASTIAEITT